MPPGRVNLPRVIAMPCRVLTPRALQPTPTQHDRHPNLTVDDRDPADPDTGQIQDAVE
jgi:hypothetical protein